MREYRVLIIEDEQLTADTYVEYLARAGGYEVVHHSPTMADALRYLHAQRTARQSFGVDVVLLDMNLPDGHGLEVLRQMRAAGFTGGVLAMTAATELETIRRAIALGVVQYLVKPFGYREFADRLRAFREVSAEFAGQGSLADQSAIDRAFRTHRSAGPAELPKGLTEGTLSAIADLVRDTPGGHSAGEVGAAVGTSRVTARRYLEYLYQQGMVDRQPRYGTPGRPENEYLWSNQSG